MYAVIETYGRKRRIISTHEKHQKAYAIVHKHFKENRQYMVSMFDDGIMIAQSIIHPLEVVKVKGIVK